MLTRRIFAVACLLAVIPMTARQASAQAGPASQAAEVRRPYRGLFGGPVSSDSPHSLVFTGSVYAAYDDNVVEAISNREDRTPWLTTSGPYQGADAGLDYIFNLNGDRLDLVGHAGGSLRYYRHADNSDLQPWGIGDVTFDALLTKSLTFTARQSVNYSSAYNSSLMPRADEEFGHDIGTADVTDLALFGLQTFRTASSVGLTQRFGRHAYLEGAYHYRTSQVIDSSRLLAADHPIRRPEARLRYPGLRPAQCVG
jgi:hypothetical protein